MMLYITLVFCDQYNSHQIPIVGIVFPDIPINKNAVYNRTAWRSLIFRASIPATGIVNMFLFGGPGNVVVHFHESRTAWIPVTSSGVLGWRVPHDSLWGLSGIVWCRICRVLDLFLEGKPGTITPYVVFRSILGSPVLKEWLVLHGQPAGNLWKPQMVRF